MLNLVLFYRLQKQNTFLDLDDGLARTRLQVVVPTEKVPQEGQYKLQGRFLISPLGAKCDPQG
jgi:hypothetical protein